PREDHRLAVLGGDGAVHVRDLPVRHVGGESFDDPPGPVFLEDRHRTLGHLAVGLALVLRHREQESLYIVHGQSSPWSCESPLPAGGSGHLTQSSRRRRRRFDIARQARPPEFFCFRHERLPRPPRRFNSGRALFSSRRSPRTAAETAFFRYRMGSRRPRLAIGRERWTTSPRSLMYWFK